MALKHFHFSHYKNSQAATNMWEVVSPALFEVGFTLPKILTTITPIPTIISTELMFEHVRSISGLDGLTPTIGNVVQKYKYAERHYAAAGPDKTSLELTITFTMNLDDTHQNYIYNALRSWYNLIYNPQNGQTLTKKQYADGSILRIYEYDRDGSIWRKIVCKNFFPSTPPTGLNDDNYDSIGEAKNVSITFLIDDWYEANVGLLDYRTEDGILPNNYYDGVGTTVLGNIYKD